MAKRKTTRKTAAASARKKVKKSRSIQKRTKKTRKTTASRGKSARGKTTRKKASTRRKITKKKAAASKPAKKRAAKKKAAKKAAKRSKAVKKKPVKKKSAKRQATKKVAKKKTARKRAGKVKVVVEVAEEKALKKEAPAKVVEPEEPGLPLKEVRARLGLISPQIAALSWLDGLYLYGSALLEEPRLESVDFIVVYRGLRSAARLKAAEVELRELIAAVLPLDFDLNTGSAGIGRLLGEGNPAALAHLGYSEPVFVRGA